MTENTQYYLAILKDQLQYKSDESEVEACSVTWKTTYNRPVVSSLTATATENSVNVKATPSMAGTVYIAVTTGTPTTADYKSTSGTANTAVSMDFTGLESGKSYRVSAYVVANTYTSSTKSTTVSTATQKAYLSGISITGEDGRGAETVPEDYSSSDFDSDTFTYSVRMPFGTEMAYVVAAADSGITVKYLENGSYIETDGIPVDLGHATASNYVTATISAEASGMNSSSYNIRFYVAGEPGLDTISVDGDTITHDDTSGPADRRFDVSTGTLPVTIAAKDSEATVTCVELANTSGGTGTLTGDLAISSGETTNLRVTITSNGESKVYLYAVTAR